MTAKPAAAAASARPIADILADASAKALRGPEHDPKDVVAHVLAELGAPETKTLLARLLALHDLLPEGEQARSFLANVITVTHSSIAQLKARAEQLAKAS